MGRTVMAGHDGTLYIFHGRGVRPMLTLTFAPVLQLAMNHDAKRITAALSQEGLLYTWGCGKDGGLGHGTRFDLTLPQAIPRAAFGGGRVCGVSCGHNFTVAVTAHGHVFTFGHPRYGQLGIGEHAAGDALVISTPTRVETLIHKHIVMVASGLTHTLAVCRDGCVYGWGSDAYGQLGLQISDHTHEYVYIPTQVPGFGVDRDKTAVLVAAAKTHSATLTREGSLFVFGSNRYGQLGISKATKSAPAPIEVHAPPPSEGSADAQNEQELVTTVSCTVMHTLATTDMGSIWFCGPPLCNVSGSTWHDETYVTKTRIHQDLFIHKIVTACMGNLDEMLAVTEQGQVYTWKGNHNPVLLGANIPAFGRVGPYAHLPPTHALAFAMGTHTRLGRCIVSDEHHLLYMPAELIQRIVETCAAPQRVQTEGHRRLLGGG